jgi:gas vesicle protein
MNDATEPRSSSNAGSTLIGFAIGAVVGAGLAFLLAPEDGKRTRARLARGARQSGQLAADSLDQARSVTGDALTQARSTVTDLGDDVLSAVKAGRDSFAKDRAGR